MASRAKFRLESECSQASICPSCNDNTYNEIPAELGPRRMTKYSLSDSLLPSQIADLQKQYNDIVLSYHKLKISFTVMMVLNAILLIVVITCLVFIIPHISSNSDSKEKLEHVHNPTPPVFAGQVQPQTSTLTPSRDPLIINCQKIANAFGALYIDGQKVDNAIGRQCSMENLIETLKQYIKKTKNEVKNKAAFHFTANRTRLSGCRDSKLRKCQTNWEVKMNTTAIKVNGESIIVPESGIYFIYNRVNINIENVNVTMLGDVEHSLRHSNTGNSFKNLEFTNIECIVKNNQFNHVSYIEQVHALDKGDEIRIALRLPPSRNRNIHQNTWSSSTFGMFQL